MIEKPNLLSKLNTIIDENLDQSNFTILDICQSIGMSRTSLHRKVYEVTGLSTSIYVRQYQLEKAYEKLLSGNTTVGYVAYAVGFSDISYFSKCFKKYFGENPSTILRAK